MKYTQFTDTVQTLLRKWDLYSPEAVTTICMITAHESAQGKYRRQVGGGPARGLQQIEKVTHDSIWDNSDTIHKRAELHDIHRDFFLLEEDDEYGIWVSRHYLLMDTNPLPKGDINTALYCKAYWNRTGKATAEKYLKDYWDWSAKL